MKCGEIEVKDEYLDYNGKLTNLGPVYPEETKKMYLLLNLLEINERKKYMYQTDENVLAEGLIKKDNQGSQKEKEKRAYSVIDIFNDNDDIDFIEKMEIEKNFFDLMDYYYQQNYGKKVTQDLNNIVEFSTIHVEDYYIQGFNAFKEVYLTDDLAYASGKENIYNSFKKTFPDWNADSRFLNVTGISRHLMFDVSKTSKLYYETTNREVVEIDITDEVNNSYSEIFLENLEVIEKE